MNDGQLSKARTLAERLRFSRDRVEADHSRESIDAITRARELAAGAFLRIDHQVTPGLASVVETVLKRLGVPIGAMDAFVYAGAEIEADCIAPGTEGCVIRFSSALVELLTEEEFAFVLGHELGHFLLGHSLIVPDRKESVELLMVKRSQEISADRVGLLAADSIEIAIRALMKTVSGLGDRHLRFDVNTFLNQLDSVDRDHGWYARSTHPSILIRCRALLWISMHDLGNLIRGSARHRALSKIDQRVERDLDRYIEGTARRQIEAARDDYLLWSFAYEVAQVGAFETDAQAMIAQLLDRQSLVRLKQFLAATPVETVEEEVYARLRVARKALEETLPLSFNREVENIQRFVAEQMGTLKE